MTLEKYKEKIKEIELKAKTEKEKLMKEYAISNNTVVIGEVIEDHIGRIKVEKISFVLSHDGSPHCVYFGIEFTKAGTLSKRENKRWIHQTNLINKKEK